MVFAASGPIKLVSIGGATNSQLYERSLQKNVTICIFELKLNRKRIMQQDNKSKHRSHSTTKWLEQEKFNVFGMASESPDPEQTVNAKKPTTIPELKL